MLAAAPQPAVFCKNHLTVQLGQGPGGRRAPSAFLGGACRGTLTLQDRLPLWCGCLRAAEHFPSRVLSEFMNSCESRISGLSCCPGSLEVVNRAGEDMGRKAGFTSQLPHLPAVWPQESDSASLGHGSSSVQWGS